MKKEFQKSDTQPQKTNNVPNDWIASPQDIERTKNSILEKYSKYKTIFKTKD